MVGNKVGGLDTRARALLDVLVLNRLESRVVGLHEKKPRATAESRIDFTVQCGAG
jgi:hypothetical protein